ncbi:MerR family DNA-binding transcriptional regulator [Paenibacillus anaericanus]|uniref:MerR family DNA-binding transcriptional regulator n=1 Tax=Paenibacillus anaericanus TaxID=170367 RepID=A0A3S1C9Y9_9BACL|nr:MerR family DNA-binding transcriptional regulator [Paenibacillus anaericanus]RUT47043.1 MerR family DNA-binding transcriptional regulator [Paenibacillus anaericanus]
MLKLKFTIGEVSNILNIPIDTLRYYDKIGLLSSQRDLNKYRYYYLEQLDSLITIRMLRAMDVPIERIHALLTDDSLNDMHELLVSKQRDIDRQLTYLKNLSQKLDFLKDKFQHFEESDVIELVQSNPSWVLLTDSIMESTDKKLGSKVQLQLSKISAHQEWLAFCHIISIVSKDNLLAGNYHSYLNNGILSTFPMEDDEGVFMRLEPSFCARKCVVISKEGYTALDDHYEQMKTFIHKRGLKIAGNSLEINLYNQYNNHYIEIYIPVIDKEEGWNEDEKVND